MKILSFKRNNIIFTSIILILAAILISSINYAMSMNSTVNRMNYIAKQTMTAWSPDIKTADVEKLVQTQDENIQKHMIAHFDNVGKYQPQVAQAYLFGVELANGTDTSIISAPTFLMNEFADSELFIGNLYTQPQVIVDSIKKMKKSKKQTMSIIYTDSYGTWITLLKPLFNKDGDMFAYYGIDFDASTYLLDEYQKMATIIGIFVLLIIILWLYYSLTTNRRKEAQEIMYRNLNNKNPESDFEEDFNKMRDNFQIPSKYNSHSLLTNTGYLNTKKDLSNDLKQQANLINTTIHLITTIAKESKIALLHAQNKLDNTPNNLDNHTLLIEIIERSTTNSKLINRLIQEVQTTTDKGVQLFQANTLLTYENREDKKQMTSLFKDIITQTTFILNNIKEVHEHIDQIILINEQLSDSIKEAQNELNSASTTDLLLKEINLFNTIVISSKSMKSTVQVLEKLTIDNEDIY